MAYTNLTLPTLIVIYLYSTNTDSWKDIHVYDPSPSEVLLYPRLKLGPVINGAVYVGHRDHIVSFDLHNEVCSVIPIPSSTVINSDILDFEGSVAVIFRSVEYESSVISLWTLDDIQGKVSWTKKFDLDHMSWIYSYLGDGLFYGRTDKSVLSRVSLWTLADVRGKLSWIKKFNIDKGSMYWVYSYLSGGLLYGQTGTKVLYDYTNNDFKSFPGLSKEPEAVFSKQEKTEINHGSYILDKTKNLQVEGEDGCEIEENIEGLLDNIICYGRLWTNKKFNRKLIKTILSRMWGVESNAWTVKIKERFKDSFVLVFSFKEKNQLKKITEKAPWFLNNGMLVMGAKLLWMSGATGRKFYIRFSYGLEQQKKTQC
ncbi:hypothetical protein POM88_047696 [Heracleum sosnowskyi]|uniref:DUF4283 domain-containing protein n=1 Tax=Heracleum sosnowskyi TaxID=360622 RepID=A0AAD8GSJ3_9APIA|nr:hypothetical protein POM88_047696 [Heracleum sosnowskyi]